MASEAVMVAMVDSRVAQVATGVSVVHMAEAGWRSSRLGDGWERTGTGVGQRGRHRLRHSRHHSRGHMTAIHTLWDCRSNTLRVHHDSCSSPKYRIPRCSVCRQSR